ncbi:phosphonate metabolism transcriptional regulator PhnF [Thioclava sp. BHET1]|nr:phosphonate metabolism transcriptional regulator PhnF [Thioclava sp. BHET1]
MARSPLWKTIATTLQSEIAAGQYMPGDKLPTEAELSARFGVNRHTVRQAVGSLAEAGLVHSRRGAGVFVASHPLDYPIGRRVRFHRNLALGGHTPAREITRLETRRADAKESDRLSLPASARVHVYEGISFSDGVPIGLFRSVFPAERFPGLTEELQQNPSITQALSKQGLADYVRVETRVTAKLANATQALALKLREGAPILRCDALNADYSGMPVEFGRTWFAGDRVTVTIQPD